MTRLAPLVASLLAAACAAIAPAPVALDGLPSAFEMGGRMSVAQSGRGEIFRIRWNRAPPDESWVIATPVGTEVARIEREAEGGLRITRPGAPPV